MIVDYYLGKSEDKDGNTVNDYLTFDDDTISRERNFIPWIFPSSEQSHGYDDAPVMDEGIVAKFREDNILREMVRQVVNRYLKFLNNTDGWRNTSDHNHIRITRMIRFLATIGMREEAEKVAKWCSERGGSKKIKEGWLKSVEFKPPWDRKEESPQEETKSEE